MKKKIFIYLRVIILIPLIILAVMHPRISNIFAVLVGIVFLVLIKKFFADENYDENTPVSRHISKVLSELIIFGAVLLFGSFFDIFCPYHAIYEYKGEMAELKTSNRYYNHFPDTIPKEARKTTWYVLPSVLQGSGYECLFFHADADFINQEMQRLSPMGKVYGYDTEANDWSNISFPSKNNIPHGTEKNTTLIIFYNNNDWNHPQISGAYLNPQDGFIGYFCE